MKKTIRLILLSVTFLVVVFFYPAIEKYIWFKRVIHLKNQETALLEKSEDISLYVTKKLLISHRLPLNYKGLKLCSKINSQSLIEYILPFINNEDSNLTKLGLNALSLIADSSSILALSRIAKISGVRTRLGILQILSDIKKESDFVDKIEFFKDDPSWIIRMTFSDELANYPCEKTVEILKELLSDNSFEVAYAASLSLGKLGIDNEFVEIFAHLHPKTHWTEKFLALRLLTLFPKKMVSLLAASYIESSNNFLAIAALEWMMEKGDERDFSLIVQKTQNRPIGVVKFVTMKALAYLAKTANKESQVIVTLLKHFKLENEDLNAYLIKSLKYLGNSIAADEIYKYISHHNLSLANEAILAIGSFKQDKYLIQLSELVQSPHSKLREAAFLALINYEDVPLNKIISKIQKCVTKEEVFALGLFLLFHSEPQKSFNILHNQYKQTKNRRLKLVYLEMMAVVNDKISNLDLIKLIGKKNLTSWERAKVIMDRSTLENITTSAFADGFMYYINRQPKNVGFSLMSFSSANQSFWEQKDILYIAGQENKIGGKFEGIFLYEDYNSYWCTIKGDEILQMNKEKISDICFSPLSEMILLKKDLKKFNKYYRLASQRNKWTVVGFFIQKALMRIEILKTEIKSQPIAMKAIHNMQKDWMKNIEEFNQSLSANNLISIRNRYVTIKEAVASEIEELDPVEAKRRKSEADDLFNEGIKLVQLSKFDKAIIIFKKTLLIWPFHKEALKEIGTTYAKKLDFNKALEFYKKLKTKRPNDVDLINNISIIYREMNDNVNALKFLTQEIEVNPTLVRGRLDACSVLVEQDRIDDAIELLNSGLNVCVDKFSLHQELSKIYREDKNLDQSIYHMEKCVELKPQDSESLTYLAFLYFSAMKVEQSIQTLKRAIAYDISYIPARLTLADVYISEGMIVEAEKEVRKILVIDPLNAEAKELLEGLTK